MTSASTVERVFNAIASLSEDERRELYSRLGVEPRPARPTQTSLFSDMAVNTLRGAADYVVVFDGGSEGNPGRGYGSYAINGEVRRLVFGDDMTNNEAEYTTLLHALEDLTARIERTAGRPEDVAIEVRGDSALVLHQMSGEWKAKDDRMRRLRDSARALLQRFKANRLVLQPRTETVKILGH